MQQKPISTTKHLVERHSAQILNRSRKYRTQQLSPQQLRRKMKTVQIYIPALKNTKLPMIDFSSKRRSKNNLHLDLAKFQMTDIPCPRVSLEQRNMTESTASLKLLDEITKLPQCSQKAINQLIAEVRKFNAFFRKVPHLMSCALFKISKLNFYAQDSIIYQRTDLARTVFILVYGKVLLTHKKHLFKKVCRPGNIFGEEILFHQTEQTCNIIKIEHGEMLRNEKAKAVSDSYILELDPSALQKLSKRMYKFGFKSEYKIVQNLFLREFYEKQSLRRSHFF